MSVIVGIAGGFGHDAAAALIVDGVLVALIEEERLIRKKRAPGEVPSKAIIACLKMAGLKLSDVDTLSIAWDSSLAPDNRGLREIEERLVINGLSPGETRRYSHHLCHAASATWFHPVGQSAIVIVADGRGEVSSTSVFRRTCDGQIKLLDSSPIQSSLGSFYAAATQFTGFGSGGQGKTMALAAFGEVRHFFGELSIDELHVDLAPQYSSFEDVKWSPRRYWFNRFCKIFGQPRPVGQDINMPFLQSHADAAATAQFTLETVLGNLLENVSDLYPDTPVLMSGGVALNCSVNKVLRKRCGNLVLNPIPHDGGTALGAAMLALQEQTNLPSPAGCRTPYLGQGWEDLDLRRALDTAGIVAEREICSLEVVAEAIADGAVVGWFDGRAEAGPRALGHRSIVASAEKPGLAAKVNAIKGREPWRPFGPSLLEEDALSLFGAADMPYMIEAIDVPDGAASIYTNITHKDQTTRPQTVGVSRESGAYRKLLETMRAQSGAGIVLNTSFNVGVEPIVDSPSDAINTFLASELDMLYLGGRVLIKDSWKRARRGR